MGWVTGLASVASTLYGGHQARKAADAQKKASEASIAEQRAARDQAIGYQQPYMQYGQGMGGLAGLDRLNSGDYSGFENSPDYQYAREQMIYGQDHSASARGRLQSGGYAMDLAQGLNGLASQNLGNYRGNLQWGAGMGQNAANASGQFATNAANQISNGLQGVAGAAQQRAGANAGVGFGLAGLAGNYLGGMGGSSAYGGGSNASSFGLPAPVTPYANTGYGSGGNWFGGNG